MRRVFPFATRRLQGQKRATLSYHLGLDPGLEEGRTSLDDYRANLRRLMAVIEGKRKTVEDELQREMDLAAKAEDFETAAKLRNQLFALINLTRQVIFSDKEFLDISKDHALNELVNLLSLSAFPRRIEGYDISHMQGTDVVASMVVFTNGVSNKSQYRKFKTTKEQNDDFRNMHETIARRFSPKNVRDWGKPQLVLIDGGKGQLDAAIQARNKAGYDQLPFIGLAKREEQIVIKKSQSGIQLDESTLHKLGGFSAETGDFILINVPHSTNLVKLLQRIRDESHRFAVSYHSVLKIKRQTASLLDDIPGVGPATRKKLLKAFGSWHEIAGTDQANLAIVVGDHKAKNILAYLKQSPVNLVQ
jgi:excinuclease ABC subunit C